MTITWRERFLNAIPRGTSCGSKAPSLLPDEPEVIVRGNGCRVWDDRGREFIDFRNSLGPVTLGYRFPAVDDAIRAQLENGIVFGHPHPLEVEVAEQFCALVPGADQAQFLKTGGEAVAATIRVARAFTGRDHIVHVGYHGWLNVLAEHAVVRPGVVTQEPLAGVPKALAQLHHQVGWDDRDELERLFAELDGQIAAVVVAADYTRLAAGAELYPFLRELTERHGTLLVYDEIVTGFRVAIGGVNEHFGVRPDLMVFAKGIANGMPLSVFAGRRDVLGVIRDGSVGISSTLAGETLSLAAAHATMTTYQTQDVIGHLWRAGERLWTGVNALFAEYGVPLKAEGLPPCPSINTLPGAEPADASSRFFRLAYRHGVSLYAVSYVNFSHSEADIDETLERLEAACREFAA